MRGSISISRVVLALVLPVLSGCVTYHYIDTCTRSQLLFKPEWSDLTLPAMPSGHCDNTDKRGDPAPH